MALIAVTDINTARGAGATADSTYIGSLITRITSMADGYCNRALESAAYSAEIHDGGRQTILVKNPPIAAGSLTVYEDHDAWAAVDSSLYVVNHAAGTISLESGTFASGRGNVKVAYTGGWTSATMPAELAQALIEWVLYAFQRTSNGRIGVSSVNQADSSITYETASMPDFAKEVLSRYRVRNG